MKILSPAKINLHLRVAPPVSDGFHPLLSWMCTVGLHDEIEFRNSTTPGVKLTCDLPNIPLDETNLIARAAKLLDPNRGARNPLQKKIPMGGGLGGGSSNAAFALRALNELWNLQNPLPTSPNSPPNSAATSSSSSTVPAASAKAAARSSPPSPPQNQNSSS